MPGPLLRATCCQGAQRLTASVVWQFLDNFGQPSAFLCSTPYGISGLAASSNSKGRSEPYCAQRLTASVVWQTFPFPLNSSSDLCSTPYGISGLAVLAQCFERELQPVLNALRHQWFGSLHALGRNHPGIRVLNALRHQWFGSLRPKGTGYAHQVLNALRHQWFGSTHSTRLGHVDRQCSTPYGISGLAGSKFPVKEWNFEVLNALRHQWFGSGDWSIAVVSADVTGAQRLTASVVWQKYESVFTLSVCQCSTPYGISGLAEQSRERGKQPPAGAQRLTASVVWQYGTRSAVRSQPTRCSTPYGISGLAVLT